MHGQQNIKTYVYMYIGIRLWRLRVCTREISDIIAGNMIRVRTEDFSDLP